MVVVDPSITAKTERLLLRPLKLEDADDILLIRSEEECMKYTSLVASDDIEKTKAWIQGCFDSPINWNFCIELLPSAPQYSTESPRVIGMIGAVRAPEIGYMFNTNYWGKGYATEALKAFMPMFFDHYSGGEFERFEYSVAMTDPELVASQSVLKKAGFKFAELREKDFESAVLGVRDTMVFKMERPT
ncbi:GNAT domain-containing protein [Lophiotrema nucula]|uniref:GNAT domain-containing protein n=1 Tax=Lophiotrema nucula TaxID=690887 RepID=A0A6A5Z9J6_9PLEO|nr:GNAT domain-containing protein [Lophiotrema nucula]